MAESLSSNGNLDCDVNPAVENRRRPYHAPSMTLLGAIESVVKNKAGTGADAQAGFTGSSVAS